MFGLGLALTLRSGREGVVRLVVITVAVAVAVALLLAILADFRAFTAANDRGCWECTKGVAVGSSTSQAAGSELWNYSVDYYQGKKIERLDVAALGPNAPIVPGLPQVPAAGRYYVSPAMAALLATTPQAELGQRFPGTQAGQIGPAALASPDELVIVTGYPRAQLAALPATIKVDRISAKAAVNTTASGYTYGFGVVAIAMFIPLLILINMATRLAGARRNERYAAMRLVGATPSQISVIAAVDAMVGAVLGTLVGVGLFLLVQPAIARVALTGARYFPDQVQPSAAGYAAVIVAVPLISVLGALRSLRSVRIDPMGVVRRTRPRRGMTWAALLLPIGLVLFELPTGDGNFLPVYIGLILVFAGLVSCGAWLTGVIAGLMVRGARGPDAVLASRRLMDDPRAAFRSVSGLVIAVFIGTATAGIVPALVSSQVHVGGGTLTNVMRTSFTSSVSLGLPASQGAKVLDDLRTVPGLTVLPMYSYVTPNTPVKDAIACGYGGGCTAGTLVVSCAGLQQFPALGKCPAGSAGLDVSGTFAELLLTDNMLQIDKHLPAVSPGSHTGSLNLSKMFVGAVLVQSDQQASLERARTLLIPYTRLTGATGGPETFGEVAQTRAVLFDEVQRVTLVAVGLTLLVAGASLAVAVAGSMVERKRPFTLLRLTGAPLSALYRVALLEAVVPLAVAGVVAVAAGLLVAGPVVRELAGKSASELDLPGAVYLVTGGVGLLAAFAVIAATLPLLGRITRPETVRFE